MSIKEAIEKTIQKTTDSVAVVEQGTAPAIPPVSGDSGLGMITTALGGALGTVILAAFAIRRKYSSDSMEIKKDRVEGALLDTVMKERDAAVARADRLQIQANLDAASIAGLTEKNSYLQQEVTRVNAAFARLEQEFDKLKVSVQNLNTASRQPPAPVPAPAPVIQPAPPAPTTTPYYGDQEPI